MRLILTTLLVWIPSAIRELWYESQTDYVSSGWIRESDRAEGKKVA